MSVSKYAYDPEICDGEPCPGDCDHCDKAFADTWRMEEVEEDGEKRYAIYNKHRRMVSYRDKEFAENVIQQLNGGTRK